MKFRPLHDRVVIRRVEQEARPPGGIIIPDTAKEKPQEARSSPSVRVPGTSAARSSGSMSSRVTALFGKWSGSEVRIDNEEYLIMKEARPAGRDRVHAVTGSSNRRRSRHDCQGREICRRCRDRMLHGIDTLANAVKVTLGPRPPASCWTRTVRRASPRTA